MDTPKIGTKNSKEDNDTGRTFSRSSSWYSFAIRIHFLVVSLLVGGRTNPFEKYARQYWESFPHGFGVKIPKSI